MLHLIYRAYVFWRNFLFDRGILSQKRVHLPVVSVGNIVAGGTGKTSLVYKIASDLNESVGILSRGYAAKVKVQSQLVTMPEEGDEAFLLAQKLPFAKVVVGRDRVKSAESLQGVKYILLDDGMQHRYIHRDVEIVVMHASDPFGGGHYLPKGMLRDSPERLKKADWIFIHGGFCDTGEIRKYSNAPIIHTQYQIENKGELAGRKIGAFCAIGTPAPFFHALRDIGCDIVLQQTLPDHSPFEKINEFCVEAKKGGAEFVVCTEKDYVKLKDKEGVRPLRVSLEIIQGGEEYARLQEKVRELVLGFCG